MRAIVQLKIIYLPTPLVTPKRAVHKSLMVFFGKSAANIPS
jgi:hypothetical protein